MIVLVPMSLHMIASTSHTQRLDAEPQPDTSKYFEHGTVTSVVAISQQPCTIAEACHMTHPYTTVHTSVAVQCSQT